MATEMSSHLTSQILMLYYVLTYQDCLLSNMKSLGRRLLTISGTFIPVGGLILKPFDLCETDFFFP